MKHMYLVDAWRKNNQLFGKGLLVSTCTPKGAKRATRKAAIALGFGLPDDLYVYERRSGSEFWFTADHRIGRDGQYWKEV